MDTNSSFKVRTVSGETDDLSKLAAQTVTESKEREAYIKQIKKDIGKCQYDNIKKPVPFMSQLA